MPKQLNVNMSFTADTSQAKRQLQDLQKQLSVLSTTAFTESKGLGITKSIDEATISVAKLKAQLQEATNTSTGMLDLGKFTESMQRSGMSLEKYRDQLVSLGPAGKDAFLSLTQSIANAETPLLRANSLLKQLGVTVANAARWQISSSIIHGFIGAVQGAYGYAQDLNKSLNSIRIVTGDSTEKMAEFANQANKSAQALSTSTLAYTDAALIFYQQGLDDEQVSKRVETTLKMSNVTGESADEVSSYMTAIWNNFYDGSQSLESFADKITALGAATASSSREIAGGLQQFAAIADTVGLSYDYAATALATVVAQTRQSESTVGNSFRTIFSRLQGLQLGETLEDGTDLNKYSGALATIGVNIKDQNGELKQMDTILEEIGAKWKSLSKDQQMALAQTVGGVRQYTNLIALFDNWDTFQRNLDVSRNADGTLEEQAEIYADSWEAAQKRVKTAWQAIYQDLIDDKFFIKVLNGITSIIKGVDKFIDTIGGLKGVLGGISYILITMFQKEFARSIEGASYRIMSLTKAGRAYAEEQRSRAAAMAKEIHYDSTTDEGEARNTVNEQLYNAQENLLSRAKELTEEEMKQYQYSLDMLKLSGDQLINEKRKLDTLKEQSSQLMFNAKRYKLTDKQQQGYTNFQYQSRDFGVVQQILKDVQGDSVNVDQAIGQINQVLNDGTVLQTHKYDSILQDLIGKLEEFKQKAEDPTKVNLNTKEAQQELDKLKGKADDIQIQAEKRVQNYKQGDENWSKLVEDTTELNAAIGQTEWSTSRLETDFVNLGQKISETIKNAGANVNQFAETITQAARGISSLMFGISSLSSAFDVFNDKTLTTSQQITQFITSMAAGIPMLINGATQLGGVLATIFGISGGMGTLIVLGVTALGAAFSWLIKKGEEAAHAQEKALKEAKEEAQAAKEEVQRLTNAYEELKSTLDSLDEKREKINELTKSSYEWTKAVQENNSEILNLLKQYDLLGKKAEYLNEVNGVYSLREEGKEALDKVAQGRLNRAYVSSNTASANVERQEVENLTTKIENSINDALSDNVDNWNNEQLKSWEGSATLIPELLDRLAEGKITLDSEGLHNGSEALNKQEEILNSVIKSDEDLIAGLLENTNALYDHKAALLVFSKETGHNLTEGQDVPEYLRGHMDQLVGDQFTAAQEGYLSAIQDKNASQINDLLNSDEDWASNLDIIYDSESGKFLSKDGNTEYNIQQVKQAIADAQAMNEFNAERVKEIIEEENKNLESSGQLTQMEAEYNQQKAEALHNSNVQNAGSNYDTLSEYSSILSGGETLDEEQFGKLSGIVNSLLEEFPELTDEARILNNELLEGTQMYGEALSNVMEKVHELKMEGLQENVDEEYADLKEYFDANQLLIEIDESELDVFKENLEEFLDADHELTIEVHSEAEQAFENIEASFDKLREGASMIGENFVVEVDQLRELNQIFPGILEGIQYLSDGTAQLNQEMVEGAMDSARAAAQANAQATIDQLHQQSVLLHAKAKTYEQMADAARVMAEAEVNSAVNSEEAQETLSNGLSQIKQINSELTASKEMTDAANVANNAQINAGTTASNWAQGFDAAAKASYEFANQAIANNKAASDPKGNGKATYNPISSKFGGGSAGTTTGGEDNLLTRTADMLGKGGEGTRKDVQNQWNEIADAFDALSKSSLTAANDIDGMIAELGGMGGELNNLFDNVRSGAGSSSGGKGGGGGKSRSEKEHKELKEEEDRYHDIKSAIDQVQRSLDRLGKTKDRVYGKAKLKYLDAEIAKLQERKDLEDEYIRQIRSNLAKDQAKLQSSVNGTLQIDSTGRLTNYEEILQNLVNDYNGAVNSYNGSVDAYNGGADESIMSTAEEYLNTAEEAYNKGKEALDQYEETYNLLQDELQNQIDLTWELYDLRLESITVAVDFELHWNERDLKYLDWLMKYIGDDATKGADKIANLAKQMDVYNESIEVAKQGIAGIFANHGISLDFNNLDPEQLDKALLDFMNTQNLESQLTQEEGEALEEYLQTLMDNYDGLYDSWKKAHEQVNASWDAWNERIERETDRLENYADELESIKDIIDLTGRNMLNLSTDDIDKMNQSIVENGWAQVESWKAVMEARKASMEQARYYMENAQTEEVREQWRESFEQFEDDYNEANKNYYSSWESTLKNVEKAFSETMDNLEKDYNKAMGDLTLVQEQFARKQEINHLYLDDYEKYHELNKSVDELRKSLENTNSTMMKSKMNDLLDEMNASMRDGVNISEAQAEIYARRVALLQAEAELLDAQNAKSAVRMTRDNEGNFSYTYTADQDQIDDAETNYQDKFYEVLSYERQYMEDIQGQMLDMTEQFWSDYYDLCERYKDDSAALEEAVEALVDDYNAKMDFLVAEQEMDMDEMARLRDEDWKDFENLTNKKLANQDDFIADFRSTIVGGLYPQYQTANQYAIEWQKTVERTTQAGNKAVNLYQTNTQHTFEVAGQNIDTYGQRAINKMNDIANQSQDTKQKVTDMAGEMQIDMSAIMSTAWSLDTAWGTVMNNMRNQIAQTVSALSQLLQRLQAVQAQAQATIAACAAAAQAQQVAALAGAGAGTGTTGNRGGNPGGNPTGTSTPGEWHITNTYESPGHADAMYWRWKDENDHSKGMESTRVRPPGFATGGYTGAWGPEGKIAMLHEKELVLNKEDTSNILNVVESVRDMVSNFGRNALNNLANAITNSGSLAMAGAGTLDQNVHIEASFPNVQSHTEIELALNNLINSASQYVNRK